MHLHLYRPVMLSRAGRCVCLTDARDVSPREAAALVRLRLATWVDFGESGEAGRASPLGEAEKSDFFRSDSAE